MDSDRAGHSLLWLPHMQGVCTHIHTGVDKTSKKPIEMNENTAKQKSQGDTSQAMLTGKWTAQMCSINAHIKFLSMRHGGTRL